MLFNINLINSISSNFNNIRYTNFYLYSIYNCNENLFSSGGIVINNIEHKLELVIIKLLKNLIYILICGKSLDSYIISKKITINEESNNSKWKPNSFDYKENEHKDYQKEKINLKDIISDKIYTLIDSFDNLNNLISKDSILKSLVNEENNKNFKDTYRNKLLFIKRGINYLK